ncbi:hypothetical protein [Yoonia sp. 2307UL14-13]|uniref:hypothetical protein n=1 Tax=Yoonia sp. 2307UL14-13 TaxID=3126506 RepID=UPI0030B6DEAC
MRIALPITLAFVPMIAGAQTAFCTDDLANVAMQYEGLPRMQVIEPGTATGTAMADPFVTVQLMLGIDARDLEVRLTQGTNTIAVLQDDCVASVPNCTVNAAPLGTVAGYIEHVAHWGLEQFKWRTALGGQMLMLRITTSAPANPELQSAGAQAWNNLAREILPPC